MIRILSGQTTALAADAYGAEAQDDVTAGNLAAKTTHGLEARKQQHLVKLMLHFHGLGARKNLVADHLALGVHGDVEKQAMWKSQFGIVLLRGPVSGRIGKRDE